MKYDSEERVPVVIGAQEFDVRVSDGYALKLGLEIQRRARLIAEDGFDDAEVLDFLKTGANRIDEALGAGSMAAIADGNQVTFAMIMGAVTKIIEACSRSHAGRLKVRYGIGGKTDKDVFSLSEPGNLPETAEGVPIRTDFRVILRCLRILGDDELENDEKERLLKRLFYDGDAPEDWWRGFERFVGLNEPKAPDGGVPDFDYEQDARELYAAFMQTYRIDPLDVSGLHWWKFRALLNGVLCGDNALTNKIRLRHLDDSKGAREASLARAKDDAALKTSVSRAEKAQNDALLERLKKGLPINDLME